MRNTFSSAAAAALLLSVVSFNAHALPAAPTLAGYGAPAVTLVEGGCGEFAHRDRFGVCRRNLGGPREIVVEPALPLPGAVVVEPRAGAVVVEPRAGVVVVEPRACPLGSHWAPRWRRCVLN